MLECQLTNCRGGLGLVIAGIVSLFVVTFAAIAIYQGVQDLMYCPPNLTCSVEVNL